jgi:16S rRNA (guanine527-N7)-methyltransferase
MNNKEKFEKYADMLREWSERMNLIAPSTLDDIESRHIADSMQLADYIPHGANVMDMGSGAGFPAAVLAIMGWNVVAIESVGKKAEFLRALKTELDLPNFDVYNGRVENYVKKPAIMNNKHEIIFTARAFAPLKRILDWTFCKNTQKGRYLLLKGRAIMDEIQAARKKYDFDYKLYPSKTGDGFIIDIKNVRKPIKRPEIS